MSNATYTWYCQSFDSGGLRGLSGGLETFATLDDAKHCIDDIKSRHHEYHVGEYGFSKVTYSSEADYGFVHFIAIVSANDMATAEQCARFDRLLGALMDEPMGDTGITLEYPQSAIDEQLSYVAPQVEIDPSTGQYETYAQYKARCDELTLEQISMIDQVNIAPRVSLSESQVSELMLQMNWFADKSEESANAGDIDRTVWSSSYVLEISKILG